MTGVPSIASRRSTWSQRSFYRQHPDPMQPDGVGPVGRTRREDPGEPDAPVVPRVHLQHIALRFVQPRENDDLLTGLDPIKGFNEIRDDLQPRIGSALITLLRRVGALFQVGVDPGDRTNRVAARCSHIPECKEIAGCRTTFSIGGLSHAGGAERAEAVRLGDRS